MAAAVGPMLSTLAATHVQAPYSTSSAPSMADSLPTLDFKFDELRATMSSFTRRFDAFIEQGRRRVLDERNQFKMRVAEMGDQHYQTSRAINTLTSTSISHNATLAAQTSETNAMHTEISALTTQRDKNISVLTALRTHVATTKSHITTKRAALKSQQSYLSHQASANGPELEFWESHLGLRIESTGEEDRIRFVFEGLDERNKNREAWCVLDVSGVRWGVVECRPRLEAERVETCLAYVRGEGEDLRGFLKGMRALFVGEMRR